MIAKEITVSVRQVLPGKHVEQALPDGSTILIRGRKGEFSILRPGAHPNTAYRYESGQTLLIHTSETSGILFQPYQPENIPKHRTVTKNGTVQSWETTIAVHQLMPGEAEEISTPAPMTIFGGNGVIYIRDKRTTSGPDLSREQFTVNQGDTCTIYQPVVFENWLPSVLDSAV